LHLFGAGGGGRRKGVRERVKQGFWGKKGVFAVRKNTVTFEGVRKSELKKGGELKGRNGQNVRR